MDEVFDNPHDMSFFDHLSELRRALVISGIAIVLGTLAGFIWHKPFLDMLMSQVPNVKFVIVSPAEGFTAVMRLSILLGLFLGLPVLLREVFWFVGPALTSRQRLVLIPITLVSYLLFLGGVIFAYFAVLPLSIAFLIGFTPAGIQPMLSIDRYIGFASLLIFSMGLVFQVPVVLLLSSLFGLLQRAQLTSQRRYAILVCFVVAAVITPSVDIMTQSVLGGTLFLLFELGLLLMWFAERFRRPDPYEIELTLPAGTVAQNNAEHSQDP